LVLDVPWELTNSRWDGGVLKDEEEEEDDTVRLSSRPNMFSKLFLSFSNADAKSITDWALFPPMAMEDEEDELGL
jgi:hypothetical protein